MNKTQLQGLIDIDPILQPKILGVFAEDNFPFDLTAIPAGFISNTEQASKPGLHWVSFYVNSYGQGFFFDSFGRSPPDISSRFYEFFVYNKMPLIWNTKILQDSRTSVCGFYCIFFLSMISRECEFSSIVDIFSSNNLCNDMFVFEVISSVY